MGLRQWAGVQALAAREPACNYTRPNLQENRMGHKNRYFVLARKSKRTDETRLGSRD
jgi:hypothetical protein